MRLFIAATVLFLTTASHADENHTWPRSWTETYDSFKIAGPIHYVGTKGLSVYLIKSNAGLILLSGGMPGSDKQIVENIQKLGFDPKAIKLMLTSHAHIDHVGSVAAMKKLTGATLAVMGPDAELLKSGGKKDFLYANDKKLHFEGVEVDRSLKDGETVTLGDVQMTAHWTPGHTKGCTTWEMTIEEGGKKYSVLFPDGVSVNPGTKFVKDASYPGIAKDYERTFKFLESQKPDIFLSYHAEFFDLEGKRARMEKEGVKAWVDPENYKKLIARKKSEFEKLLKEEIQKAGSERVELAPTQG